MLNSLRIQNFKSWKDTGDIQFGSITGFFGTNSSGKTSILQFLLMLKQTVESSDRARVLHLGDEHSYVELGTLYDVIHNHADPGEIIFEISWKPKMKRFLLPLPSIFPDTHLFIMMFYASVKRRKDTISLEYFGYKTPKWGIGFSRKSGSRIQNAKYKLITTDNISEFSKENIDLIRPSKFYGFPMTFHGLKESTSFSYELQSNFEILFNDIFYLGPLREYPKRSYSWSGEQTAGVGNRGERVIAALLASRNEKPNIDMGRGKKRRSLEEHVAYWLKELGLISSFAVSPMAPNRKEYEVRVKRTEDSSEVFLTDVGFGVSQLLPVLVLLFYVPEGSTIILEQPEIHLHPAVQAGLADVFIDAIKRRNVQIILESHSEHLLQRLQRRLAEEALPTDQVKLYFTDFVGSASTLTPLDLDEYGNIRNWPKNFFGDTMGEASAMMEAELKRRTQENK